MFDLEIPQSFKSPSRLVSMLTRNHALCREYKGAIDIPLVPIQFTVRGTCGNEQSEGLGLVGDFRYVAISVTVFIELA